MSMQVKGKFIRLEAGEALTQKKQNGDVVEVIKAVEESGQVKVKANGQEIAYNSQIVTLSDSLTTAESSLAASIASEASTRQSEVNALDARLDIIEGSGVGSVYKAEVDANQYADGIVLTEKNRAETAEAALSAAITAGDAATLSSANTYTDGKISDLVNSAPAVLDTLKELADALGSDPNFATTIANSITAVQTAVDAEETRATNAETGLAAAIAAEVDARMQLAEAHSMYLDNLDNALEQETAERTAADNVLQGQLDTLGAVAHYKEKFVLSAADLAAGYIELSHLAKAKSTVASVGRLMIHEADEVSGQALAAYADDYYISEVAGKTRLVFVGNLVAPSDEQLAVGDVIYVKYMA